MNQRGQNEPGNPYELADFRQNNTLKGTVFPGKPTTPNPYQSHNLAVQRSLMEIFDEFTDVISGELKSMKLNDFESERKPPDNSTE